MDATVDEDLEDTGLGKKGGGILRSHQKKFFGTIPYFLVIADYEKAFLYVALKKFFHFVEKQIAPYIVALSQLETEKDYTRTTHSN